ncbi:MAG: acetyl/propionyl/methylcrotonyl-CoA carboxylase subunit alpha [Alphaproteobacteria bacterium]|nr:acetyl/propionyl/methylcrotonyl-CoA carboxylase subunit alpha [Alphaproteobacteria bacterium]
MFSKILIANRGEIACRVIKTARRMGVETVVVYSDADAGSMAVDMADEAIHIGGSPAAQSYLVQDKIIDAVRRSGAEAVHPGFGFLSENASFARRLESEKIVFVGPNPFAIEAMGDKITSKKFAAEAGVTTVPGHMGLIENAREAVRIADSIGYPVMIKASAGGGGKGLRIAFNAAEAREGFEGARAEAIASFGDDRIFIEKFVDQPRHIEIQVLGDKHGNIIYLNERECSIQRRNQKVFEEAPSPFLTPETRKAMGEQAVALSRAVQYDSAGTVEFIVDGQRNFYFLEMNTRLQVEHPVTEMITGYDLVEQMLRVAAGEKLSIRQKDVGIKGWALESRIYAEDPYRNFLPSIGRLKRCRFPAEGKLASGTVRIDTGVREGDEISMFYDPMIAKLITHGKTRADAIKTHLKAIERLEIRGIQDNSPFLAAVLNQARFQSGEITTAYIKEEFPDGFHGALATEWQARLIVAAAAYVHGVMTDRAEQTSGRAEPVKSLREDWVVLLDGSRVPVKLELGKGEADITFLETGQSASLVTNWTPGLPLIEGTLDDEPFALGFSDLAEGFVFRRLGVEARVLVCSPFMADLHSRLPEKQKPDTSKLIMSPMPGLVVSVAVSVGQDVKSGEAVCIVEAMKMQNIIRAEADGVVKAVNAAAGASVAADEILVEFA